MDGIGEKIGDELAQAIGIAASLSGAEVAVNIDAALFGQRSDAPHTEAGVFRQIDSAAADLFLAGIEARELEQRFGKPSHLLGGVQTNRILSRYSAALRARARVVRASEMMTARGVRSSCEASAVN